MPIFLKSSYSIKNGVGGNSRKKELFASIHIVMNGQKIYCPI